MCETLFYAGYPTKHSLQNSPPLHFLLIFMPYCFHSPSTLSLYTTVHTFYLFYTAILSHLSEHKFPSPPLTSYLFLSPIFPIICSFPLPPLLCYLSNCQFLLLTSYYISLPNYPYNFSPSSPVHMLMLISALYCHLMLG